MKVIEFIKKFIPKLEKKKYNQKLYTLSERIAGLLLQRYEEYELDFDENDEYDMECKEDFENTELIPSVMNNLRYFCKKDKYYFRSLYSSDVDYLINKNYSRDELMKLVHVGV